MHSYDLTQLRKHNLALGHFLDEIVKVPPESCSECLAVGDECGPSFVVLVSGVCTKGPLHEEITSTDQLTYASLTPTRRRGP